MPNYNYVIDSSFRPFSMQELLTPFATYKEVYDETQAAMDELQKGSSPFSYLAGITEDQPNSKAAQIYNNYMTELNKQAEDFATHGLNLNNKRALTQLKRRYFGEIGQLEEADKQLKAMQKIRDANLQSGKNMLYGKKELLLDDFLNGNKPNTYAVDLENLKKQGIDAAKAISSRQFEDTEVRSVTNYLQEVIEKSGYNPEVINNFRENMDAIPALKEAIDGLIKENQIEGNLSGEDYDVAKQTIIDGILEGVIYDEKKTIRNNPGVETEAERVSNEIRKAAEDREKEQWDIQRDLLYMKDENNNWILRPENIPEGYELDPSTGRLRKKVTPPSPKPTPQQQAAENRNIALQTINTKNGADRAKVLANEKGFTITYKEGKVPVTATYTYVGGIADRRGKDGSRNTWHIGMFGDDLENRGWGFTTSSNVVNKWGKFSSKSLKDDDVKERLRILSEEEFYDLIDNIMTKEERDSFYDQLEEKGINAKTDDIQLIEVPNESKAGDAGRVGYIIAVSKKER